MGLQWPFVRRSRLEAAEAKYFRLRSNMREAERWLTEWESVSVTLTWLLDTDSDFYRKLGEMPRAGFYPEIGMYRDYLRRQWPPGEVGEEKGETK